MLKIETTSKDGVCSVKIAGAINESTTLDFDYGSAKEIQIDCALIARMNSMGVRNWSARFEKLRSDQIKLRFLNVSVPVISQCNFVVGLMAAGEVESLAVPYFCESCTKEFTIVRKADEIRTAKFHIAPEACPFCQATAEFDGSPVTFFTFMT